MITMARILLVVAALSSGLITGLLMTLIVFFHKGLRDLPAPHFALVMQRFLGVVRTHPLHYGLVITSLLTPVAALVLLRGSAGGPAFILTLLGLVAFVAGPVLVSRFSVEPLYDVFLGWNADSPPEVWRESRDRYFRLNVIRGLGSRVAFVLFLAGLALA
jgi:uncharacterized membrane protein